MTSPSPPPTFKSKDEKFTVKWNTSDVYLRTCENRICRRYRNKKKKNRLVLGTMYFILCRNYFYLDTLQFFISSRLLPRQINKRLFLWKYYNRWRVDIYLRFFHLNTYETCKRENLEFRTSNRRPRIYTYLSTISALNKKKKKRNRINSTFLYSFRLRVRFSRANY